MTEPAGKTPLPGSERSALDRPPIGEVPGSEPIDAVITLRPGLDRAGADRVRRFLEDHGITVENEYAQTGTWQVRGTAAAMQNAFSVRLARYFGESGDQFRARSGPVYVPDDIAADVTAVLGLDDRNTARPQSAIAPRAGGSPLTPLQVAKAYRFPAGDGQGETVGIIELGGAFTQADLDAYLASLNLPTKPATVVPVMGATPVSDGPNGADGEVMLDAEIIAALAPGADLRLYFGPNTTAGFLAAINQAFADGCGVISISWGAPESLWTRQAMRAYDQSFGAIVSGNCSVFAASGDRGSTDGESDGHNHVDFPASSPHVTGCGGTRLKVDASGALASEVVWNDDPTSSATGGGFSVLFRRPAYQKAAVQGAKRGVPDVAGNGDPVTGYPIRVDGQNFVIGGTSAVSPLMSGLTLRLNQIAGRHVGDFNAFAYSNAAGFTDVTSGDNGGFAAGAGWDPTTGLGSPVGGALLTALTTTAASGAPPTPSSAPEPVAAASADGGRELMAALQSVRTAVDALTAAVQDLAAGRGLTPEAVAALPSPRDTVEAPVRQPTS